MRRAADHLADCLAALGADRMFCVPGESYLALLDALYGRKRIDLVVCRHEGGAGMMAVADAKLTGRPGLLAVSRGPGATNASIAIHLAQQDAVPLMVLVGQVARHERGRGAFQEVDYSQAFREMTKGVWEVQHAAQMTETLSRAWKLALSGTPGPVVIALPEDMLGDPVQADPVLPPAIPLCGPGAREIESAAEMLASAERPLIIAGGGLEGAEGRAALKALAEAQGIPVALTFKHQEIFDNGSSLYAGHLGFKIPGSLVKTLSEADLILALGTRLGDVPTQGYRLPRAPGPDQPLIHVWPDPAMIGKVFRTDLGLPCDPAAFCRALAGAGPAVPAARAEWRARAHGAMRQIADYTPQDFADGLDFGAVVQELARQAPRDSIVVTDSGNFSGWVHLAWPWDGTQKAIGAVGGAMGLGVPGAVAASLRHPEKTVLGFVGDGGALMTGNELATAMSKGARPKIIVSDNRTYGTIRLHQERDYPDRVSGTDLVNPDFAAWAAAFGVKSWHLSKGGDIAGIVGEFLGHEGPALLSVASSAEAISAYTTISALHERTRRAQSAGVRKG
ncbi:acetolactate synthase [Stappia sp. GBMRC 2046]|uniref:Acetolactate synthase n=1 Tax=Stappia sediminis TaxID=2692190 RepID=A0A7X3LWI4_9HYPH|nr:thiamine pyrophosphate-binding protein [Stappia sediminis]MXN66351.1 acetolactate synthase [Stappia sediminis]